MAKLHAPKKNIGYLGHFGRESILREGHNTSERVKQSRLNKMLNAIGMGFTGEKPRKQKMMAGEQRVDRQGRVIPTKKKK